MGQKVTITKFDDIDGTEGSDVETFQFSVDGKAYEIDVTPDKADRVREVLSEFIEKGRRASGKSSSSGGTTQERKQAVAETNARIRVWAKNNGLEVPERGRIPQEVRVQYEAANAA